MDGATIAMASPRVSDSTHFIFPSIEHTHQINDGFHSQYILDARNQLHLSEEKNNFNNLLAMPKQNVSGQNDIFHNCDTLFNHQAVGSQLSDNAQSSAIFSEGSNDVGIPPFDTINKASSMPSSIGLADSQIYPLQMAVSEWQQIFSQSAYDKMTENIGKASQVSAGNTSAWEISQASPSSPGEHGHENLTADKNQARERLFSNLANATSDDIVAAMNPGTRDVDILSTEFDIDEIPSVHDIVVNMTPALPPLNDVILQNNFPDMKRDETLSVNLPSSHSVKETTNLPASSSQIQKPWQSNDTHEHLPAPNSPPLSITSSQSCSSSSSQRGRRSKMSQEEIRATRRVANMSSKKRERVRQLARDAARRRRKHERMRETHRRRKCDELQMRNTVLQQEKHQLTKQLETLLQAAKQIFSSVSKNDC